MMDKLKILPVKTAFTSHKSTLFTILEFNRIVMHHVIYCNNPHYTVIKSYSYIKTVELPAIED